MDTVRSSRDRDLRDHDLEAAISDKTLARRLVEAFGDPEAMRTLYANDVTWVMSKSLGAIAGPYNGHEAVEAFNERVWGSLYFPEVEVEILDELGNDELGAVRFIYRAKLRRTGEPYELEYVIFARGRDGLLTEVFESMDTLGSANLFAGQALDVNPYRA